MRNREYWGRERESLIKKISKRERENKVGCWDGRHKYQIQNEVENTQISSHRLMNQTVQN